MSNDKVQKNIKEKLYLFIDNLKDAFLLVVDRDFHCLYYNIAFAELMKGRHGKDIALGRSILECISSVENKDLIGGLISRALTGEPVSNVRIFGKNPASCIESFYYPFRDDNNEIIGAVIRARDVTYRIQAENELRESEQKWRTLFQLLPVGISILDKNGNITEHNQALEKILRLSKNDIRNKEYANRKYIHHDLTTYKPDEFPSHKAVVTQNSILN